MGGACKGNPNAEWLPGDSGGGAHRRKCLPTGPAVIKKREETINTGCLGNTEKGKTQKYGNTKTIRSCRRIEG
ncbi:hypothetical protein JOB18_048085 [Solea senegalensis]|uniref:Uncharacterized protein n=1 Tax=Solea senegalensis TaxID=28829 RepID=A0AAV6SQF4_SOLSE|nr:hypothetical protein JOB18_048085 [Solea senegalensis]